jgi:hypothetical protein
MPARRRDQSADDRQAVTNVPAQIASALVALPEALDHERLVGARETGTLIESRHAQRVGSGPPMQRDRAALGRRPERVVE